jgi:hypothetical protein
MGSDDLDATQAERAAAEAAAIGGEPDRPAGEDPAERPVREAGGGEAEGFEEAEDALVDHAEHGDLGHSPRLDAHPPEAESDRSGAAYADADDVASSAREEVREDASPGDDAA